MRRTGSTATTAVILAACLMPASRSAAVSLDVGATAAYSAVVNFDRADYFVAARFGTGTSSLDRLGRLDTAMLFSVGITTGGSVSFTASSPSWNTMRSAAPAGRHVITIGSLTGLVGNNAAIDTLASQFVALRSSQGLDGVDVDWEDMPGVVSVAQYAATVERLASTLRSNGLIVSTSHAQGAQYVPYAAAVADVVDHVNLQFYFAGNNAMSLDTFKVRLADYVDSGVRPAQIRVGLPSYGMVSGSPTTDKWRSWSQLLARGANVTTGTAFTDTNGETYYYSGTDLISRKIAYAKANGFGGVFTWELTQDVDYDDPRSFNRLVDSLARDAPPVLTLDDTNAGPGPLGTGVVTLGTGAVLNNGVIRFARTGTLAVANRIDGTGRIEVVSGTVTLSGSNRFTGGVAIGGGRLRLGASGVLADSTVVGMTGGVLDVGGNDEGIAGLEGTVGTVTGSTGGSLSLAVATGSSTAFAGAITGGMAVWKSGAGTLRLGGTSSTFSGGYTTVGGVTEVVRLSAAGQPSSLGSGGTLRQNGGAIAYVGPGDTTDRLITFGPSSGGGSLSSTLRADGVGPLVFSSGSATPWGTPNQPRALTLGGTSTAANSYRPRIADNGTATTSLAKSGAGTWILTGTHTHTGSTSVNEGRLVLAGAITSSTVTVAGGATLAVAAGTDVRIHALSPAGTGFIDVGSGELTVLHGLAPVAAATLARTARADGSWRSGSGIGSTAVAAAVARGESRAVGWLVNGDGSVTFAYAAPGDANLDGMVDVLDGAACISSGLFDTGVTAGWFQGDFTMDGVCDILDISEMVSAGLFDAGPYLPPASAGTVAAVPEPTAPVAVGVAAALLWRRRRSAA
jgi:autotransporter-associated beta strand protein